MIFFESWTELWRTAASAVLVYAFVVLVLRVMGKRSASKMNNFDWIVTIAMGAIVGSSIVRRDTVLMESFVAIGVLLSLQYALTSATAKWGAVSRKVRLSPTLLVYDGEMIERAMAATRVTHEEVKGAARAAGHSDLADVRAVVLETNGSLSVVGASGSGENLLDEL